MKKYFKEEMENTSAISKEIENCLRSRGRSGQKIPDNPTRPGDFWPTRNPTILKLTRPDMTRNPKLKTRPDPTIIKITEMEIIT